MADGPAGFTRGSTCPALLRMPVGFTILRVPDYHRLRCDFPDTSPRLALAMSWSYNPTGTGIPMVWAVPRSLAATGGITFCFLFLWVLRCFSSPGSPPHNGADGSPSDCRVAPFGHLRVTGRLHLTGAFRSLPRPSSPSRAKASAVRPFFLSPPDRAKGADRTFTWFLYFPRSAGRTGTPLHACVLLFQHVNERAGDLPCLLCGE